MTGRENQYAVYVRDRWSVTDKLTLSLGLRMEYYPLMTRADGGIERLDYNTYTVLLGGRGDSPRTSASTSRSGTSRRASAPCTASPRRASSARATGARSTRCPGPARCAARSPTTSTRTPRPSTYGWATTLAQGIPIATTPDLSSGRVTLPPGVYIRSPNPTDVDRGVIQSWNVAFEQRLPWDISAEIAYVGTATDGGYADLNLNYGEPGGGNASRKYYSVAGTTSINDWASAQEPVQGPADRAQPPVPQRPDAEGRLHAQRGQGHDDGRRGRLDRPGLEPSDQVRRRLHDRGLRPDPHRRAGLRWQLPFFKESTGATKTILDGWQVNPVMGWWSGTPFAIGGTNNALNCPGCGTIYIVQRRPRPLVGWATRVRPQRSWDISKFSSRRRRLRGLREHRPLVLPAALGVERRPVGVQDVPGREGPPEIRVDGGERVQPPELGHPDLGFTANNFLQSPRRARASRTGTGHQRPRRTAGAARPSAGVLQAGPDRSRPAGASRPGVRKGAAAREALRPVSSS